MRLIALSLVHSFRLLSEIRYLSPGSSPRLHLRSLTYFRRLAHGSLYAVNLLHRMLDEGTSAPTAAASMNLLVWSLLSSFATSEKVNHHHALMRKVLTSSLIGLAMSKILFSSCSEVHISCSVQAFAV